MSDKEDYDFGCTECDHRWNVHCDKFEAMDVYDEPCPGCGVSGENITRGHDIDKMVQDYSPSTGPLGRRSGGYFDRQSALKEGAKQHQELLHKIHENSPGSKLNEKFT